METVGAENRKQILSVIDSVEKQVAIDQSEYVKSKLIENREKLDHMTSHLDSLSRKRGQNENGDSSNRATLLMEKQMAAIAKLRRVDSTENNRSYPYLIRPGAIDAVFLEPIELPKVEKIPPFTTSVYAKRNQKMKESDCVTAKTRIYYDFKGFGGSDNEEEKREFGEHEDIVICKTVKEIGPSDSVLAILAQRLHRSVDEVKERYETLLGEKNGNSTDDFHDKDLDAALDSIGKLFCRRCYIFNCQLHGCSENHTFPEKRQEPWSPITEEITSCGSNCYKTVLNLGKIDAGEGLPPLNLNGHAKDAINDSLGRGKSLAESTPREILFDEKSWRNLEKELFNKGLEIFGKNSCLIARNMLSGMKTCREIFQYMNFYKNKFPCEASGVADTHTKDDVRADSHNPTGNIGAVRRSRSLHGNGSVRPLKFLFESTREENICQLQYSPCSCQASCGEQCPCQKNGTCCEKYCGCPQICRNRFRGCYCEKNQCRGHKCPCFAADRECDPDLCRNCWVSCGDSSRGASGQRDVNKGCNNMKILLKQHQRVLLGISGVAGWGVFLKNSVDKDEYIGEYTGEIITQGEANKSDNTSSFLFDLNGKLVVDGLRIGNKLKFANHSPNPNCYTKVITVCGEQRIAIFSKYPITAGEELFYDYHYDATVAPDWARNNADA